MKIMETNNDRKRVMIIGQPGSGKSTLARELGEILDLPVFYIDQIHWKPGWIERGGVGKDRLCSDVHSQDKWIFEGGRSTTWAERIDRADTLIWLDFTLPVRSWRIFTRTIRHYGESRPDLPKGCPERFSLEFTRFVWKTRKIGRERQNQFFNSAPVGKDKYRLCSQSAVEQFKATVTS